MILLEETQVAETALPTPALREHLRLGTGFAEDTLQDAMLGSFLRAAMSAIEGRTSRVLLTRDFVLRLSAWRSPEGQPLPLAPVSRIDAVGFVDPDGVQTTVAADRWRLEPHGITPMLRPRGSSLPVIPTGQQAEVRFTAGFAADFAGIPADLQQAVMLLAAHYYEYRDETALSQGCMPFGVTSLIARYMPVRLGLST